MLLGGRSALPLALRLIRSGKSAPRRLTNWRKPAEAEIVEVAGQRKLLQWTVPGIAHFFTMWGFTILMVTILEAYGSLFHEVSTSRSSARSSGWVSPRTSSRPRSSLRVGVFTVLRLMNAPSRRDRASRFYGSHTGAAWMVLRDHLLS